MKVHVQQPELDQLAGNMSKCVAKILLSSRLKVIPDTGHSWILDEVKEILETLFP